MKECVKEYVKECEIIMAFFIDIPSSVVLNLSFFKMRSRNECVRFGVTVRMETN